MHKILEFLLPVAFSSAEAMIWMLLIVTLIIVGRGKILPSEKALVIERKGQYSMALAPGLNLAQPFIEAVAKLTFLREASIQDGLLLCFEVRDKHIATKKSPSYVLAISMKSGGLHFEAKPVSRDAALHETGGAARLGTVEAVEHAVLAVGKSWGIDLRRM